MGIIFISPIIGLTRSLMDTFKPLTERGAHVIGVDIFDEHSEKKTFWKVLGLTMLPGANSRRVAFANTYNEDIVFDKIEAAIQKLQDLGKKRIVVGGMSGGFIFAARAVQDPADLEIQDHAVRKQRGRVHGLFGISPLIFYPHGVYRPDIRLDRIPQSIPTILFFANEDDILPSGTIEYALQISKTHSNIRVHCLDCSAYGEEKPIRHQFFGGEDFIWRIKNAFWHPQAERHVLQIKTEFLKEIARYNVAPV